MLSSIYHKCTHLQDETDSDELLTLIFHVRIVVYEVIQYHVAFGGSDYLHLYYNVVVIVC